MIRMTRLLTMLQLRIMRVVKVKKRSSYQRLKRKRQRLKQRKKLKNQLSVHAVPVAVKKLGMKQLLLLQLHGYGYVVALVFFGVHCLVLGWLVMRSRRRMRQEVPESLAA